MTRPVKIFAKNFWPGFSLEQGFVSYLLKEALGNFQIAHSEKGADLILLSVFPRFAKLKAFGSYLGLKMKGESLFPSKTIGVIWENQRPDYRLYDYSISSDFDSYEGRNCRIPLWLAQIRWAGMKRDLPWNSDKAWSGFEPLVELEQLLNPRKIPQRDEMPKFCSFIASNPEPHRLFAVEALSRFKEVEVYGKVSGKVYRGSKYDLLRPYMFNLCFENSIFPGYYTEKVLQSWAGGCIPLYFSDSLYATEFNHRAIINRCHFETLDLFAEYVSNVASNPDLFQEIYQQPLLIKRPSLNDGIEFIRRVCSQISG